MTSNLGWRSEVTLESKNGLLPFLKPYAMMLPKSTFDDLRMEHFSTHLILFAACFGFILWMLSVFFFSAPLKEKKV